MSLASIADVKNLVASLNIPHLTLVGTSDYSIKLLFANHTFAVSSDAVIWPFRLEMEGRSATKYHQVTGKTLHDLRVDFLYHWLDNFSDIQTFQDIRARIKDPAMCGSFVTTYVVNKYIIENTPNEQTIKELFSGSKWRWKKSEGGTYIQQTLWEMYDERFTEFYAYNNNLFYNRNYIKSGKEVLKEKARAIYQNMVRQQEEQEATLLSYGTRATDTFEFKKGKNPLYTTFLGVELELEGHSSREFTTLKTLKEHAIFKKDGSLNAGVEICTAPATLDVHKEAFKKFFDAIPANRSKLKAESTCGMHVHIDKSNLSNLHIANICLLMNNPDNERFITSLAGRSANRYCKTQRHSYQHFVSLSQGDRYSRVNLNPSKTIEFRLFASTTDEKEFNSRLEFTQAVIDYTRPGETNITCKNIPKWDLFKEYVMKHRKTYPTLVKEM